MRLDAFLAPHVGSRTQAVTLIAEASVTVDGVQVLKRHAVRAGECVRVAAPAPALTAPAEPLTGEPPPPAPGSEPGGPTVAYTVAYTDEYLLVVDKPAGLVVHPGRGHREGTLSQALGLSVDRGGIVHRLDRDTSGLLVVARTERIQRELQAQIKAREVRREYLTLVGGRPEARAGTIDAPIGRDRHSRTLHSLDTDTPRAAVTHFEIVEACAATTLLRVRLETGRTHQIRVHLQAIGHPVIGDPTYGAGPALGLERQFLHAARLAFTHPGTGEPIDLHSPLPGDLERALAAARGG
ncbi:RluA family pseudouridine synthase [Conexibacter sp. DBS9H8]|uniref:RluA family pseudouridine synthase n=1 Tax=Conexibacter sp. DBS9H8 TaxID=2937801 RepID=UPI0035314412